MFVLWYNPIMNLEKLSSHIMNTGVVKREDCIVLGLSGGPDSVCLFYGLNYLKDKLKLDIHCVHVNHGLRGDSSDSDEEFVRSLCKKWDIPLFVKRIDCNSLAKDMKISVEEAGREARYDTFFEYANSISSCSMKNRGIVPKIAVAQNLDDQAETIIYRIIRGTGINGLTAMKHSSFLRYGFEIIRPILDIEKKEILEFLQSEGIQYCVDHTNNESIYTRNKIRLDIIPQMEKINASAKSAIVRLGSIAAEYEDFLDKESDKAFDSIEKSAQIIHAIDHIILPVNSLLENHHVISKRMILTALTRIGVWDNITYDHLESVLGLLTNANPSAQIDLPKGYVVCRIYDRIGFFAPDFFLKSESDLKMNISYPGKSKTSESDDFGLKEHNVKDRDSCHSCIDIPGERHAVFSKRTVEILLSKKTLEERYGKGVQPVLRYRRTGDYIYLTNGGRKKIKNLMIDEKIPRIMREFVPILAVGSEVIWVGDIFGKTKGRVSAHFQLGELEEEDCLSIEILM